MNEEPELDTRKQIAHWRKGALEAWSDAEYLIKGRRILLGLFAAHLALEKKPQSPHLASKEKSTSLHP